MRFLGLLFDSFLFLGLFFKSLAFLGFHFPRLFRFLLSLLKCIGGLLQFLCRFRQIFCGLLRIFLGFLRGLLGLLGGILELLGGLLQLLLQIGISLLRPFFNLRQSFSDFLCLLGSDFGGWFNLFRVFLEDLFEVVGDLLGLFDFLFGQLPSRFGFALLRRGRVGNLLNLFRLLLDCLFFSF